MADASGAVQTAIYDRLTGDATLMGMVKAVHDQVPEDAKFPYVTIGDDTATDFDTKTETGQELTLTLHAWSRAHGRKEVKDILARIYALLHEQALTITGFTHVLARFEFTQTFRDPDGLTQHGVARYRVIVQG
ncbi:MAG: DUF3168 domain-containing protein [Kiloniellales bacterium]